MRAQPSWTRAFRLTLVLLIAGAACGPGAPEDAWTGTIEVRDGASWVTNPAEPLWPAREEPYVRLELEQVFGADEEPADATLALPVAVTVDDHGNVYVVDGRDHRIAAFAPDGRLTWQAGRQGEGPGELNFAPAIAWDGSDRLYVLDDFGAQLEWWDTSGNHLGMFDLTALSSPLLEWLGFVAPGRLGLLTREADPGVLLLETRPEPAHVGTLTVKAGGMALGRARLHGDVRLEGGRIVTGSLSAYEFREYDGDGALRLVVRRPAPGFLPPTVDQEQRQVWPSSRLSPPVRLESGHWLAEGRWPTDLTDPEAWFRLPRDARRELVYRRVLDLFDAEGRWLWSRPWDDPDAPEHGDIVLAAPDGRLYTVTFDPFPQIRRYRVVVEEPES